MEAELLKLNKLRKIECSTGEGITNFSNMTIFRSLKNSSVQMVSNIKSQSPP